MKLADFRHTHRLQVRQSEVDGKQVVFNAHYLSYFDVALEAYWRRLGLEAAQPLQPWGGSVFVRRAAVDFLAPAHLRDGLAIALHCREIGRSSLRFDAAVFRGEQALAQAEIVQSFVPDGAARSAPVPEALRGLVQQFNAGEEMMALHLGPWAEVSAQARAVRAAVFTEEQRIPADLDHDGADEQAVHVLVRNRLGTALSTGRLLQAQPGVARIGRMAVLPMLRSQGLGRRMLRALVQHARQRKDHTVGLHAQWSAVAFYLAEGFVADGAPFEEAGIVHQAMVLRL
jgi:YbgC/YbaW family acyl-CoA thioester hydrolase